MVLLTRKIEFAASHLYNNPDFSPEENRRIFGKCNNPHGHGHNYTLEVTVAGEPDPITGMVLDLKELKEILEREVMQRVIWQLLDPKIKQGKLHRVRLYETSDLFADCYRNGSEGVKA
jgi:6-pyruvoyltetrahydropterin/6-carboxytetrahydropterin synthase